MDSSTSKVGSGEINRHAPSSHFPSKKAYGFTIAIIMGIVGLVIGAAGLASYCHAGALSHMAQFDAIMMMSFGGGGGAILLIIVGAVKNRQSIDDSPKIPSTSHYPSIQDALPTIPIDMINIIGDYANGVLYGPEAWGKLGVAVLDTVPPAPKIDLSKNDKVLLYIPQRVRFNGKEQNLTLNALKEIAGDSFGFLSSDTERQFGDIPASAGWVLIDKTVISESRGKTYEAQQKMVEERGCSLPIALEAAALNLMVFGLTGERLYREEPWTYTRCLEKVDGQYPVVVGGFGSSGLRVSRSLFDLDWYGVACARRKF